MEVDPDLTVLSAENLIKGIQEQAERSVREVMLPIVTTAEVKDNLIKLIYEMGVHNISLIPVLEEGKVVGVVRTVDILYELAQLVL